MEIYDKWGKKVGELDQGGNGGGGFFGVLILGCAFGLHAYISESPLLVLGVGLLLLAVYFAVRGE